MKCGLLCFGKNSYCLAVSFSKLKITIPVRIKIPLTRRFGERDSEYSIELDMATVKGTMHVPAREIVTALNFFKLLVMRIHPVVLRRTLMAMVSHVCHAVIFANCVACPAPVATSKAKIPG